MTLARSKKQQMTAGTALAAKRGQKKVSELKNPAKQMYQSMSVKDLEDIAGTKSKNLLDKKTKK